MATTETDVAATAEVDASATTEGYEMATTHVRPVTTSQGTLGPKRLNRRMGGGRNHSLICLLAPQPSILLHIASLHSTPLRVALLAGSFVSEKVAMY